MRRRADEGGSAATGTYGRAPRPGLGGLVLLILMALGAGAVSAEVDRESARADMRQIYASIEVLLPLSVDEKAFRSAVERPRIRHALAVLAERAEHVGSHVGGEDRRFQFLGGSLSREAEESLRRFEGGQIEAAQFYVQRLTDFCVACHSSMPSPADSPLARNFVSDKELAKLPLQHRASLQVATRRFDDAMKTYESLFASPLVHPAELLDPLTEYLTVAIRVKNDLKRPVPILEHLAARPDLWSYLRKDLDRWLQTLELFAPKAKAAPTLASARSLVNQAHEIMGFPTDRQALVHYLLASSQLHRYLEVHAGETSREVAEAYYLLGLIDSRTNFNYFVSESDFYLETAIRLAPDSAVGQEAYALLEEETVLGWSGSSGSHMPEDVAANLATLRALVYPNEAPVDPDLLDQVHPD